MGRTETGRIADYDHHATDAGAHAAMARASAPALLGAGLGSRGTVTVVVGSEGPCVPPHMRDASCALQAITCASEAMSELLSGCAECLEKVAMPRPPGSMLLMTLIRGRHAFHLVMPAGTVVGEA